MTQLDVHTEHCCIVHGCKYGDEDCTVTTGRKPQSFPCEACDGEIPALPSIETLPPGTRPTEPGWYAYRNQDGEVSMLELERRDRVGKDVTVYWTVRDQRTLQINDLTFIARIYPDRIGQE